jgi:hypothetical protein
MSKANQVSIPYLDSERTARRDYRLRALNVTQLRELSTDIRNVPFLVVLKTVRVAASGTEPG